MKLEPLEYAKAAWGDGPWLHEPDRVDFEHAGLPCLLLRNRAGAWCGYAAVPPGHPLHGKDYETPDVEVHGGLTYASACDRHICHVPKPGEPDDVWWFGFDCSHSGDISPAYDLPRGERYSSYTDQYRTVDYARAETARLAEQLAGQSGTGST